MIDDQVSGREISSPLGPGRADEALAQKCVGASEAEVVPLRPRRTYLEAMHEQGRCNAELEMVDENAKLRAKLDAVRRESERLSPAVASLAAVSCNIAAFQAALDQKERELSTRFRQICEAYMCAGYGDQYFPLLLALLFEIPTDPDKALGLFQAANINFQDPRTENEEQK